jgi:hypothetical protein
VMKSASMTVSRCEPDIWAIRKGEASFPATIYIRVSGALKRAVDPPDAQTRKRALLDGGEHGRRMHVPAGPISSDRDTIDRSCLPLPLVQRETGTAHALNALYEADRVAHTAGKPEIVVTPSASGKGQKIARCPACRVAVWSNYPQAVPPSGSSVSAPWTILVSVRRTSTFSRPPSSRG